MEVTTAVQEFLAARHHLSPYTWRMCESRLGIFATWCQGQGLSLEAITTKAVRAFIAEVSLRPGRHGAPTLANSTLRDYVTDVKTFLRWVTAESDDLDVVMVPGVARGISSPQVELKVTQTFTNEQLAALFRACEEQPFAVRNKAIVSVLTDTGARASEVVGLTTDCVWLEVDDSYIKVVGKGKKEREIGLGRTARLALRRYITRYRKPRDPKEQHVFIAHGGKPLRVTGLSQLITKLGNIAGIQGVHCHRFRHHFACQYLIHGGDVYKLSRLMGHESVKVTERYLSAVQSRQARQDSYSVLDHLRDS